MKNWAKAIFILSGLLAGSAGAVTDVYTASGTWTAPDGVTSVDVEAWAGGGAGGGATANPGKGGGGAGGQYAKKTVAVVPGGNYAIVVGPGGSGGTGDGGAGGDSTFAGTLVVAKGGAGGTAAGAQGAGSVVGGVGDIVYPGGDGAASTVDTNCNTGGGGGGGAGSTGAGGNATGNTGGTGTVLGGGNGGDSRTNSGNGGAGAVAGGGGGGACAESNTNRTGGAGAAGQVTITYTPSGGGGTGTVTASPTLCVNDTTIGSRAWSTLNGPFASDDVWATASGTNSQITNYLKCTGYGFAIPAGAIITGITAGVEAHSRRTMRDYAVQLVKADMIQATNYATNTRLPDPDAYTYYGGATDLWGNTWTAADINDPNFGMAFAAQRGPYATSDTAYVDHMPITIDYTLPPVPVAEYRMDEGSWNGTANEVADNSGNALHGSALLGATPAAAKICNGANLAANYAEVPDSALLDITTALTVTAWIKPARWGGAPGDALMSFLSKDTNYEAHVNSTGNIVWWWGTGSITSAATAPVGAWTHVAMVYSAGSQTLYINGAASATGTVAGALPVNAMPFQIGNDQEFGGGTRRFDGMIDEVKIFNRALTPGQVASAYANENAGNNWDGTARVCPTYAPDHLEIQHASGMGLTCAASTLTIRACADAACSTLYTAGVSGTLSATGAGMTVNWDGGAGFAIPSGSSSVTKNVQVATAGSVVFGVSSSLPAPTNGTTCNFGSPACTFTANLAGFIFSDSTTGSAAYTIPALTSGVDHNTANLLWLRAVQATTANAAVCTPAIVSQTVTVDMGYTCNDPNTCQAGTLGNINGTAIASAGTGIDLTFDANGSAAISSVRYDDAGQITLSAATTVTPFVGATPVTLNGSSNAFVVAPHHFGISGVTAAPIKAGVNFAATVTAYNGLATPAVTANFGKEAVPEGVTLSFSKCQPTGTNSSDGAFSGNAGAFTGGVATASDLNWSEVGNGDLVATNSTYLGSALSPTGNTGTGGTVCNGAGNVGAFIPDHFETVVTGPMACPAGLSCPIGGLVYSGQAFAANVYARNAAGGITQNYDGTANTSPNFAKDVTLTAWDALGSTATQDPPAASGSSITAGAAIAAAAFGQGATVFGTPSAPIYTFGTTPTSPTDIYIRAADTDGVTSLRAPPGASLEGGVKVVSGRIMLANVYGSELLPLSVTATAQYYNGSWVTSITDSVSQFNTNLSTAGGNVQANIVNGPLVYGDLSVVAPGLVTFTNGVKTFRLAAPKVAGSADLTIINAPAYLTPSAVGRATFGVYKGGNEFIYMRETY